MEKINKQSVIWALEVLISRSKQERLWLSDGTSGEVSSFTESICVIFDDGGVSRALDSGKLPDHLATHFRILERLIKQIPENSPPQEQIDHPVMKEISRMSADLLEMLKES